MTSPYGRGLTLTAESRRASRLGDRAGRERTPCEERTGSCPTSARSEREQETQWKLSPQAQEPVAFGLSMVKP